MLGALKVVFCLMCVFAGKMAEVAAQKSSPPVHQKGQLVSAIVGGNITLECFYDDNLVSKLLWYKQTLGEKPAVLTSFDINTKSVRFYGEYRNNWRFTSSSNNRINRLMISNLKSSDSATYYCARNYLSAVEFANGTTVLVQGSGQSFPVRVHQWASGSVQSCGYVTLQCRVETGIYSCTVASCGRLLFGNGTTLDFRHEGHFPSLVIILGVALAFTSVLTLSLAILLCVMHKGSKTLAPVTTSQEDGENQHDVQYTALHIKKDRSPRRLGEEAEPECVYSRVRL